MLSEALALTTVHFMPIVRRFLPFLVRPPPQSAPSFSFHLTKTDSCVRLIKKLALTRGKMLAATGGNQWHQMAPYIFISAFNSFFGKTCWPTWEGGAKAKLFLLLTSMNETQAHRFYKKKWQPPCTDQTVLLPANTQHLTKQHRVHTLKQNKAERWKILYVMRASLVLLNHCCAPQLSTFVVKTVLLRLRVCLSVPGRMQHVKQQMLMSLW